MKYYGRSEEVLDEMLQAFESGKVPAALAQVYINRDDSRPCTQWSALNQFMMVLAGHSDARGFRQWEKVNRKVEKGEKAFYILGPCFVKTKEENTDDQGQEEERDGVRLIGFRSIPVFGYEQTDGEPLLERESDKQWIQDLPLVEVAKTWGLDIRIFNGKGARFLGLYGHGSYIALGVENLSTWAHEMIHAADDRCRHGLKPGQDKDQEIVAEVGGAVLLECLGLEVDSDRGGALQYISSYSKDPLRDCYRLMSRICKAIDLILVTAEQTTEDQTLVA